jgi:hypothetical protein
VKTSDAIQAIVRVMAPYIGDTMARAAASAHCQKLGIGNGVIQAEQVEQLLGRLGTGLNVFLGRPRSVEVVQEARRALAALEGRE